MQNNFTTFRPEIKDVKIKKVEHLPCIWNKNWYKSELLWQKNEYTWLQDCYNKKPQLWKEEIIKKFGMIYEKNNYIEISNFFFSNGEIIYKIPDMLTDLTEIERKFFMDNTVFNKYHITSTIIENYRENIDKNKAVDNFIENFFEIGMVKIINQTFGIYDLKEEKKYSKIGIGRKLNLSLSTKAL